jgi:hypothetical protein
MINIFEFYPQQREFITPKSTIPWYSSHVSGIENQGRMRKGPWAVSPVSGRKTIALHNLYGERRRGRY